MGGLMKMHHHNGVGGNGNINNSNNRGGKPYGLMIILAFGAAIIGVLALHKVRERRVINLLVQEKDSELTSLHLLLQKEREHTREAKWKLDEMKTKMHSLRALKRGLDHKIAEMQSTISSLREEQRTIESTLDEKQNEIKLMKERYTDANNDNPQVLALSEMLRQKESEVEDLRNRLQRPVKVWSVSTEDPSSAKENSQIANGVTQRDYTKATQLEDTNAGLQANHEAERNATELADTGSDPVEFKNDQNATERKEVRNNGGENFDSGITEQTEKLDNEIASEHGKENLEGRNAGEEHISGKSQTWAASGFEEEKNSTQIQNAEQHDNEGPRFRDEVHKWYSTENKVLQTTEYDLQERNSDFQSAETEMKYKGGMKLEMSDQPQIGKNRKQVGGYLRNTKRKKLNKKHRSRNTIENSIMKGTTAPIDTTHTGVAAENEENKGGYRGTLPMIENGKADDELPNDRLPGKDISEHGGEHGEGRKEDTSELETSTQESKGISERIELLRHDKDTAEFREEKYGGTGLKVEKREVNTTSIITEPDPNSLKNTTLHFEDEMFPTTKQQDSFEPNNQATSTNQVAEGTEAHEKGEVDEQTDPVNSNNELENL